MASFGYGIAGYLDSESPDQVTVQLGWDEQPFASVEEAWLWLDSEGGPRVDANVFVVEIVPVGMVMARELSDDEIAERTARAVDAVGPFFYDGGFDENIDRTTLNADTGLFRANFN